MILIRADANEKIGTGHVMRCLSIAQAFVDKGEKILFVTADHRGDRLISEQGFKTVCLDSEWTDMESEISELKTLINAFNPILLIVDSYYVTVDYFKTISKIVRVVYIDDMNNKLWDIDYLINYNIYGSLFDYSKYQGTKTKLLIGPMYAPLRKEFKSLNEHKIKEPVKDIFFSAGGSDPDGITEIIIRKICPCWMDIRFHIIVGALNPRAEIIKNIKSSNVILHINEFHMSQLMKKCDMAVSAAGTTLYELCATGIPTITYILADNQITATNQFEEQGIMLNAGDCRNKSEFILRLKKLIKTMICDVNLRQELSKKMKNIIDGNGSEYIANELLKFH